MRPVEMTSHYSKLHKHKENEIEIVIAAMTNLTHTSKHKNVT